MNVSKIYPDCILSFDGLFKTSLFLRHNEAYWRTDGGGERMWSMEILLEQVQARLPVIHSGRLGHSHGRRDDDPSAVNCEIWHWICNTLCALLWRGSVWNRGGEVLERQRWGIVAKQGCRTDQNHPLLPTLHPVPSSQYNSASWSLYYNGICCFGCDVVFLQGLLGPTYPAVNLNREVGTIKPEVLPHSW